MRYLLFEAERVAEGEHELTFATAPLVARVALGDILIGLDRLVRPEPLKLPVIHSRARLLGDKVTVKNITLVVGEDNMGSDRNRLPCLNCPQSFPAGEHVLTRRTACDGGVVDQLVQRPET